MDSIAELLARLSREAAQLQRELAAIRLALDIGAAADRDAICALERAIAACQQELISPPNPEAN